MQFRTKAIVHQVVRPVWNAWMRFGHHQLSLTTLTSDHKVGPEAECPSHQLVGTGCPEHVSLHGEEGI